MGDKTTQFCPTIILSDGLRLPRIGYGTYKVDDLEEANRGYATLKEAIRCGYRFIDTATYYQNEHIVGEVVRDCIRDGLVSRDELVVCTKLWCTSHKRQSVVKACRQSLAKLQLDYVDLYLIHWPMAYKEPERTDDPLNPRDPNTGKILFDSTHYTETWRGMEDCKDAGLTKSIGLSNFNHLMIEQILNMSPCKHKPTVNQVECHPYLSQEKLLNFCQSRDISVHAHCPLGSPGASMKPGQPAVLKDPVVVELAQAYGKSPAQLLLRFLIQRQVVPLPKSSNTRRIQENFQVFDFEIGSTDMDRLLKLNQNLRYCAYADEDVSDHPFYPFHEQF